MKRIFAFSLLVSVLFSLWILAGFQAASVRGGQGRRGWTFSDAVGNRLSGATVVVYRQTVGSGEESEYASFVLDEQGQCRQSYLSGKKYRYYLVLEHPDYGVHKIGIPSGSEKSSYRIPAAHLESEAYERSMRGCLLDDANNPLVGVWMRAKAVYPPGGQTVYVAGLIKTDELGRFHMYPFIYPDYKEKIGELIPSNSCYLVRIEPPSELGLAPAMICIPNDGEQVIHLKEKGYFHTISFEGTDGRIDDPNRLGKFHLRINKPGMKEIEFEYGQFKSGLLLPTGTYSIDDWEMDYEFDTIEVTNESLEELVFKAKYDPSRLVYLGRVVHGITGEPLEGVFVMPVQSLNIMAQRNLSEIRPKEWDALRALPVSASPDEPLPKLLRDTLNTEGIVRTNKDGRFRLTSPTKERINSFLVFEKDYLGIRQYTQVYQIDKSGRVGIPTIPLYPAAKVKVDLRIGLKGKGRGYPGVKPRWFIEPNGLPEWAREPDEKITFEDLEKQDSSVDIEAFFTERLEDANRVTSFWELYQGGLRRFVYDEAVLPTGSHTFYVPAGLDVYLMFYVHYDMKNEWSPVGIPETVRLEQGQIVDVGRCEIKRSIPVTVKVVNSVGDPIEGIPVEHPIEKWKGPYSSNKDGIVRFNVHLYSEGEFGVRCRKHDLYEYVSYEVGGEEDSGREFLLLISDELIRHFVK